MNGSQRQKELHIAPMLHVSTREFRALLRILTERAVLWTEMVVDDTVANASNLEEHLASPGVNPSGVVCQIGGNSPELCGKAAAIVARYGYSEVNLNIDCPSNRVCGGKSGSEFGACLMKKASLSEDILDAMRTATDIPISVKCRIGVDHLDDLEFASSFIEALQPVCTRFYLHARKCVLSGLMNARANRSVPPLDFPRVYTLCDRFPDSEFWINGGIRTLRDAKDIAHGTSPALDGRTCLREGHSVPCSLCDREYGSCCAPPLTAPRNLRGCMMGRAAFDHPCLFWDVDRYFYGEATNPCRNRKDVLTKYSQFLERTYPRRCCDEDERVTFQYPSPAVTRRGEYCSICQDIYEPMGNPPRTTEEVRATNIPSSSKRVKITSRIIGRCFKPIQGIFNGVPYSRAFRRECDNLGKDPLLRNCGPGYLLRKAMQATPDRLLDQPFSKDNFNE